MNLCLRLSTIFMNEKCFGIEQRHRKPPYLARTSVVWWFLASACLAHPSRQNQALYGRMKKQWDEPWNTTVNQAKCQYW